MSYIDHKFMNYTIRIPKHMFVLSNENTTHMIIYTKEQVQIQSFQIYSFIGLINGQLHIDGLWNVDYIYENNILTLVDKN